MMSLKRQLVNHVETYLMQECPTSHLFQLKLIYRVLGRETASLFLFGHLDRTRYEQAKHDIECAMTHYGFSANKEIRFLRQL